MAAKKMSLEECFEDLHDMGAHGIEILANTHIENYPNPTDEWVEKWFRLCDKYEIIPVEYGNGMKLIKKCTETIDKVEKKLIVVENEQE